MKSNTDSSASVSVNNILPNCSSQVCFSHYTYMVVLTVTAEVYPHWSPSAALMLLSPFCFLSMCLSPRQAQVLSSFMAEGVMWIVKGTLLLTEEAVISYTDMICKGQKHLNLSKQYYKNVYVAAVISHHEVRLCEDPPELLGLHVLWVTGDGFQYLVKKIKTRRMRCKH